MIKLNRFFSLIMTVILLIHLLPMISFAQEEEKCGDNLNWYINEEDTLIISGSGEMYELGYEEYGWYSQRKIIKSIIVEEGVTSVGSYAFYDETAVVSVSLPSTLISIGNKAFAYVGKLQEITLPDNLRTIGDSCFYRCSSLKTVNFGNSAVTVGSDAFQLCNAISKVNTVNLTAWCESEFANEKANPLCLMSSPHLHLNGEQIYKLVIPDDATKIGDHVFHKLNFSELTIGKNVKTIGNSAFRYCLSFNSLTIPSNVEAIGDYAFENCYFLLTYLNANCKYIGKYAFFKCQRLRTVILGPDVKYIDEYAFGSCKLLSMLYIESDLEVLADNAFSNTSNLSAVKGLYNTPAHEYAQAHGLHFEYVYKAPVVEAVGSNSVTVSDAFSISKLYYAQGHYETLDALTKAEGIVILNEEQIYQSWLWGMLEFEFSDARLTFCAVLKDGNTRFYHVDTGDCAHALGSEYTERPATCQVNKLREGNCVRCGIHLLFEIPNSTIPHSFNNYIYDNNATCTDDGTETSGCSMGCGTTDTVTVYGSATGHDFCCYQTIKEATCTENGYKEAYCNNGCDTIDIITIEEIGHIYGEWITVKEPDYDNEGTMINNCTVCFTLLETKQIPALVYIPFPDVPEDAWYVEAIEYCHKKAWIIGNDKGDFNPADDLTREQFAVILARMANADLGGYAESSFADVRADSWYGPAVIWAYQNGYVKGTGNGNFGVGNSITREELAVILYRYAQSNGIDTAKKADQRYCDDAKDISSWALDSVAWSIEIKVLGFTSTTANLFCPKMTVTRSQAAKIFMSFNELEALLM